MGYIYGGIFLRNMKESRVSKRGEKKITLASSGNIKNIKLIAQYLPYVLYFGI